MTRCPTCRVSHPDSPPCIPDGPGPSKAAEKAMRDHVAAEGCGLTGCAWDVCATHRPPRDPCDNDQTADMIRTALWEAGYPSALVWAEDSGVFVEGCPDDVAERAMEMVNEFDRRVGLA